jgi:SAM-dependent methyltransferase
MKSKFKKYEKKGAYHWSTLYNEGWIRSSPRLHARYDIPIWLLSQRMNLSKSRGIDVGCGDGVLLYKVRRKGGAIHGLDHSEEGLTLAKQQLDRRNVFSGSLIKGSCYQIPLDSESVDYVTATELLEHLDDVYAFLNEAERVIRPGGWFVCTTPNREKGQAPDEVRDPFHVHEYISEELESALDKQFSEVEVLGAYPEYLDALYVRNRRSGIFDKAVRVLFRAISFGVANPYVHARSTDPTHTHRLLVGVAQKKQ